MSFSSVRKVLLGVFLLVLVFYSGYFLGVGGFPVDEYRLTRVVIDRELPQARKDLNFSMFWNVWDMLENKYYDRDKLVPAKMVYGAIRGMVGAVGDPYTVFLPPEENKVIQEDLQGNFDGVGIQIGFKGNQLVVIAPLPDTPAERVGILAGDFIIGIKDVKKNIDVGTSGITLPEAVQMIRGNSGTTVTLTLLREGEDEPIVKDVVREKIEVLSVVLNFVGENNDIAHVRVLKFVGETTEEWNEKVVDILKQPGLNGIIVDLRNNPGGYLQSAVDLASDFIEIDSVVVTEEKSSGTVKEFKSDRIGRLKNQKVVILINKGSASASEIFTGALRDHKGVIVVGETSFGKGTIQEPQQLENGAGLHITVSKWLTPSGFWVDEGGIVPDIIVEDDPDTQEDEQLEAAIEYIRS